jgi:hypothetical protein
MHRSNVVESARRSSRVPIAVPILVTSLGQGTHFSEICETLVVSAHGCAMRSPAKLEAGVPVHFHSKDGRQTTAQVVYCEPMGSGAQGWKLGARLDWPENFWGLKACPEDWARLTGLKEKPPAKGVKNSGGRTSSMMTSMTGTVDAELSDEHLKELIAEFVRPLQAEVMHLREKLGSGEAKRSSFEVSLSQIPPELERQLEQRLRKDLGAQVLQQTREQSAQLLESARKTIEEKTTRTHDTFLGKVAAEFESVEKRAEEISNELVEKVREQFQSGLNEMHGHVLDAGRRLEKRSEDLFQGLQHNLTKEHDARLKEMRGLQSEISTEASRFQVQATGLEERISKLDESARTLESGLDRRLTQMAHNTVNGAHAQLENAVDLILKELATRSAKELGAQVDDACENLKIIQKGIESSASSSLRGQVAEALASFEHSMTDLARESVERWRHTLASGLNSLSKALGEQFLEAGSNGDPRGRRSGE